METNDRTLIDGSKQVSEDIRKDKVFKKNFLSDWKKTLKKNSKGIKSLDDLDLSQMIDHIKTTREEKAETRKAMTKLEKELEKLRKEEVKKVFGYALFDDVLLPATNNIEPPSLFKGHVRVKTVEGLRLGLCLVT